MTPSATAASPQSTAQTGSAPGKRTQPSVFERLALLLVVAAAFGARLVPAWRYFLNPDEALHYLLASQTSLAMANRAALTNSHPPLLILLLYYWRELGQSELMLRMPSVLAGAASCWLVYRWLKLVTDRATALTGLLLFAFAPTLIWLSAEIRQYSLLLFFMTACLYLAEYAVRWDSQRAMLFFSLSLYGALLTHYSSFLFALTIGIYMLVRLYPYGKNLRLFLTWAAGQAAGLAIAGYYLVTHVTRLKATGMIAGEATTYVRKSLFHAGENRLASFIGLQTLRFFTYLFSHGVVGAVALLAFLVGIALLLRQKVPWKSTEGSPRPMALLLGLPFVAECGCALAGVYPYGGTRHCILLAPFAVAGASVALARFWPERIGTKSAAIVTVLVFCNFFPSPPPMIRPRNQQRSLMVAGVGALRQTVPQGSVILTDYQSGLLLGYYACGHGVVQEFPPFVSFLRADCGPYAVMTARPDRWKFYANTLPGQLAEMAAGQGLAPGTKVWLFAAGWITDSAPALKKAPECANPRSFGENILFCQLTIGEGGPAKAAP